MGDEGSIIFSTFLGDSVVGDCPLDLNSTTLNFSSPFRAYSKCNMDKLYRITCYPLAAKHVNFIYYQHQFLHTKMILKSIIDMITRFKAQTYLVLKIHK